MATTFQQLTDRAIGTLDTTMNDSDLSVVLGSGEGALFPSSGPFHVSIGAEILICTSRSGDTLTVTRAAEGTSAAAHTAGVAVALNIISKHITDLNTAVNTLEEQYYIGDGDGVYGNDGNIFFGDGQDAAIYYDGNDLIVKPNVVGTGDLVVDHGQRVTHTAVETDDHAFEIIHNAAGYGDSRSLELDYTTGAIGTGDDEAIILVNIDEFSATGGDVTALEVLATEGSLDRANGLIVGVGVAPIAQLSGSFVDMDSATTTAGGDVLASFISTASDVTMFASDNDTVVIGDAGKFEEIEFIFDTVASNPGVKPTFEFSTGVGTWTAFTPTDGTNGMRQNGVIAWLDGDIPTWATGAGSEYLIRITRTQTSLSTAPIEDKVQIAKATEYGWDVNGDITARNINLSGDTSSGEASAIGYSATEGVIITGQGSTYDVTIKNDADTTVIAIPTGTATAVVASDITLSSGSIVSASGAISFGNENLSTTGKLAIGTAAVSNEVFHAAIAGNTSAYSLHQTDNSSYYRIYTHNTDGFVGSIGHDASGVFGIALGSATGNDISFSGATIETNTFLLSVSNTTDSTSATTGSIHTDGGLGVAKNGFFDADVFINDGGGLVVGHTAQVAAVATSEFQVLGTGGADGSAIIGRWSADSANGYLQFIKSRNATIGSNTIVQDNDAIGTTYYLADDGVDFATVAVEVAGEVDDASPAANAIGGAYVVKTATTAGTVTEALRIDSSQRIGAMGLDPGDYRANADDFVTGGTVGSHGISIVSATDSNGEVAFADGTAGTAPYRGLIEYEHSGDNLKFHSAGTLAVTIDSSQNSTFAGTIASGAVTITSATQPGFEIASPTALTSSSQVAMTFRHTTSGTATDGLGTDIDWRLENSTGTDHLAATYRVQWLDASNGTEDTKVTWLNQVAGSEASAMQLHSAGKLFLGNEDTNANMTVGLTINQGANDDIILDLKSSDIAHGLTSAGYHGAVETDSYYTIRKRSATYGGVAIQALTEDAAQSTVWNVAAMGGTADTTHTTAGRSLVEFQVSEHNGANALADITANGNVFGVRARRGGGSSTVFMVDEDGDTFATTYSFLGDDDTYMASGTANQIDWYVGGGNDMRLESDGDLHVEGDVYAFSATISSDRTLKDNIIPFETPLETLKRLNGVTFDWKDEKRGSSAGLIAQDVQAVLPELVSWSAGLNNQKPHMKLNYNGVVGLLVEAVKELSAELEAVKAQAVA